MERLSGRAALGPVFPMVDFGRRGKLPGIGVDFSWLVSGVKGARKTPF